LRKYEDKRTWSIIQSGKEKGASPSCIQTCWNFTPRRECKGTGKNGDLRIPYDPQDDPESIGWGLDEKS
jgi:hypothetical protein